MKRTLKTNKKEKKELLDTCSDEQKDFIESQLCDISLLACPGAGKTSSTVKKILYHHYKGELEKNQFAFINFSHAACEEVINKGNYYKEIFNTKNVMTTYSLAGKILTYKNKDDEDDEKQNKSIRDSNISTCIPKATNYINSLDESDKKKISLLYNLKVIIADESQDYSNNDYNFISSIGNKYKIPIIMIGDPNQAIYQFRGGTASHLLNHYSKNSNNSKKFYFTNNYRSTKNIIKCVNALRIYEEEPEIKCANDLEGEIPIFYNLNKEETLIELLLFCNKYNNSDEVTAIIAPCRKSGDRYSELTVGLEDIRLFLEKHNVPLEIHFEVNDKNNEKIAKKNKKKVLAKGKINLLTIHSSKGQEYDNLAILNFHHATMNRVPASTKEEHINKYLWYVAFSRAKKIINVFTIDINFIHPLYNKLESVMVLKGNNSPKIANFVEKDIYQDNNKLFYSITDIINSRCIVDENNLLKLETVLLENVDWVIKQSVQNKMNISELPYWNELAPVYGSAAENYLEYLYNIYNPKKKTQKIFPPKILRVLKMKLKYNLIIPSHLMKQYKKLCDILSIEDNIINFNEIYDEEMNLKSHCENILHFLFSNRDKADDLGNLFCILTKPTRWLDFNQLDEIVNSYLYKAEVKELNFANIFKLCLFQYQFDNECINLWLDYKEENCLTHFQKIQNNISIFLQRFDFENLPTTEFEKTVEFEQLNIKGRYDLSIGSTLIELKFSESISTLHKMQVSLYNIMSISSSFKIFKNLEIWNLFTGEIQECKVTSNFNNKVNKVQNLFLEFLTTSLNKTIWITHIDTNSNLFQAIELHTNMYVNNKNEFIKMINKCDKPRILSYKGYPDFFTLDWFIKEGVKRDTNAIIININKILEDFCNKDKGFNLSTYLDSEIYKIYEGNVSQQFNIVQKIQKILIHFNDSIKIIDILLNYCEE